MKESVVILNLLPDFKEKIAKMQQGMATKRYSILEVWKKLRALRDWVTLANTLTINAYIQGLHLLIRTTDSPEYQSALKYYLHQFILDLRVDNRDFLLKMRHIDRNDFINGAIPKKEFLALEAMYDQVLNEELIVPEIDSSLAKSFKDIFYLPAESVEITPLTVPTYTKKINNSSIDDYILPVALLLLAGLPSVSATEIRQRTFGVHSSGTSSNALLEQLNIGYVYSNKMEIPDLSQISGNKYNIQNPDKKQLARNLRLVAPVDSSAALELAQLLFKNAPLEKEPYECENILKGLADDFSPQSEDFYLVKNLHGQILWSTYTKYALMGPKGDGNVLVPTKVESREIEPEKAVKYLLDSYFYSNVNKKTTLKILVDSIQLHLTYFPLAQARSLLEQYHHYWPEQRMDDYIRLTYTHGDFATKDSAAPLPTSLLEGLKSDIEYWKYRKQQWLKANIDDLTTKEKIEKAYSYSLEWIVSNIKPEDIHLQFRIALFMENSGKTDIAVAWAKEAYERGSLKGLGLYARNIQHESDSEEIRLYRLGMELGNPVSYESLFNYYLRQGDLNLGLDVVDEYYEKFKHLLSTEGYIEYRELFINGLIDLQKISRYRDRASKLMTKLKAASYSMFVVNGIETDSRYSYYLQDILVLLLEIMNFGLISLDILELIKIFFQKEGIVPTIPQQNSPKRPRKRNELRTKILENNDKYAETTQLLTLTPESKLDPALPKSLLVDYESISTNLATILISMNQLPDKFDKKFKVLNEMRVSHETKALKISRDRAVDEINGYKDKELPNEIATINSLTKQLLNEIVQLKDDGNKAELYTYYRNKLTYYRTAVRNINTSLKKFEKYIASDKGYFHTFKFNLQKQASPSNSVYQESSQSYAMITESTGSRINNAVSLKEATTRTKITNEHCIIDNQVEIPTPTEEVLPKEPTPLQQEVMPSEPSSSYSSTAQPKNYIDATLPLNLFNVKVLVPKHQRLEEKFMTSAKTKPKGKEPAIECTTLDEFKLQLQDALRRRVKASLSEEKILRHDYVIYYHVLRLIIIVDDNNFSHRHKIDAAAVKELRDALVHNLCMIVDRAPLVCDFADNFCIIGLKLFTTNNIRTHKLFTTLSGVELAQIMNSKNIIKELQSLKSIFQLYQSSNMSKTNFTASYVLETQAAKMSMTILGAIAAEIFNFLHGECDRKHVKSFNDVLALSAPEMKVIHFLNKCKHKVRNIMAHKVATEKLDPFETLPDQIKINIFDLVQEAVEQNEQAIISLLKKITELYVKDNAVHSKKS